MLKAVLFDMDSTLLKINLNAFICVYVKEITRILASIARANEHVTLIEYVKTYDATYDKSRCDGLSNAKFFARDFELRTGIPLQDPIIADALSFYEREILPSRNNRFIGAAPMPGAHEALFKVTAAGLKCALFTNPTFNENTIRTRMKWAQIDTFPFDKVTFMENSYAAKPSPDFFKYHLEAMGLKPCEVLMVGDDPKRDFCTPDCGIKTAYVGKGEDPRAFWSGSMQDFAREFYSIVEAFNSAC